MSLVVFDSPIQDIIGIIMNLAIQTQGVGNACCSFRGSLLLTRIKIKGLNKEVGKLLVKAQISKLHSVQKNWKVLAIQIPDIPNSSMFFITHHIDLVCRTAKFSLSFSLSFIKFLPCLIVSRLKISLFLDLLLSCHLGEAARGAGGINRNSGNDKVKLETVMDSSETEWESWALLSPIQVENGNILPVAATSLMPPCTFII